jgi:hypothetical protein
VPLRLRDVNGDGWLDIVVAKNSNSNVTMLCGLASGGFATRQEYAQLY